jgi:hypothetical protein
MPLLPERTKEQKNEPRTMRASQVYVEICKFRNWVVHPTIAVYSLGNHELNDALLDNHQK